MGSGITVKPKPPWMRWGWFAIATIGVLGTPGALINAVRTVHADHGMFAVAIMVGAFSIRFGMIGLFFNLWWKSRPLKK